MLDDIDTADTEKMFRLINENSDYKRTCDYVCDYIFKKFNYNLQDELGKEKSIEYLNRWIKQYKFSREEILSGMYDKVIKDELGLKSISKKNETPIDIPLKTIKGYINKKTITTALVTILAVSSIYSFGIKPTIEEYKEDREITQSIGMLAAEPGSFAYEHKQSIVSQNTYTIEQPNEYGQMVPQYNENGHPIVAYYTDKIATDIIKVCTNSIELFDLCMHNVYFDMDHNRLSNMDDVVRYLKMYSKDDPSLEFIQTKLSNCDVFLDYLISRGFADPNSSEYYQILEDIESYKQSGSFNTLSKESRDRIMNLIEKYENNKNILYAEYKDNLEIAGEDFGTRS